MRATTATSTSASTRRPGGREVHGDALGGAYGGQQQERGGHLALHFLKESGEFRIWGLGIAADKSQVARHGLIGQICIVGLGHVSQLLYAGLERGLAIGGLHVAEDGHRADGQTRYDTQNAHHQAEGDGIGLFPLTSCPHSASR